MKRGVAIASIIAAFFVGVAVGAAGRSGGGSSATSTPTPNASTSTSPTQAPVAKAWVQVAHFAGTYKQKTLPFTVGSQWRVHLVNHGNSNFIVDATDPTNSHNYVNLANSIGNFDQMSQEYDAGTWYLDITGDTWDITVENYQ